MKTVLLVLAITIVTIDCKKSLYDLRKREPWNPSEIISLENSIRDVWYININLQTNYAYESSFKSKLELTNPSDVLYASRIELKWVIAATCFEYFITDLLAYSDAVVELLEMLMTNGVRETRETIDLISFDNDEIYNLPTFLFHAGHCKLEPIFDAVHLLRTLSLPPSANLATDSKLQKELKQFIQTYSNMYSSNKTDEENLEPPNINYLISKCKQIKQKITTLSNIFHLNTTPLINTIVYDQNYKSGRINSLAFKNYIYNTETCTIYVSTTNVIPVIYFYRDFLPFYSTFY